MLWGLFGIIGAGLLPEHSQVSTVHFLLGFCHADSLGPFWVWVIMGRQLATAFASGTVRDGGEGFLESLLSTVDLREWSWASF